MIGNTTSPLLISAAAQAILTPTENCTLSHLRRKFGLVAGSVATYCYFLSHLPHTFHIWGSSSGKPFIQTWLWLLFELIAALVEKIVEFASVVAENLIKIYYFSEQKKFASFRREMNAEVNAVDIDSRRIWHHRNVASSLNMVTQIVHTIAYSGAWAHHTHNKHSCQPSQIFRNY